MDRYLYNGESGEDISKRKGKAAIEKAVGFFLENNMMEKMAKGDCVAKNCRVSEGLRVDFASGDTCIEVKVLGTCGESTGGEENASAKAAQHFVASLGRNKGNFDALQEHFNRTILLVVCQEGTCHQEMESLGGELKRMFKENMEHGMEIWISEVRLEEDGITLLSYHDISCGESYMAETE